MDRRLCPEGAKGGEKIERIQGGGTKGSLLRAIWKNMALVLLSFRELKKKGFQRGLSLWRDVQRAEPPGVSSPRFLNLPYINKKGEIGVKR